MKRTFLRLGRWLHIYADHLGDYMSRWVVQHPWGTVRLHHILRSDQGRDLHDHPWDFTSVILAGSYLEHQPGGAKHVWPRGSVIRRKAEDLHRLELMRPVWTLVRTGPRVRAWGFQTSTGWVYWQDYQRPEESWHQGRAEVADVHL